MKVFPKVVFSLGYVSYKCCGFKHSVERLCLNVSHKWNQYCPLGRESSQAGLHAAGLCILTAFLIAGISHAAQADCSQFPLDSLSWTECRYFQFSHTKGTSSVKVRPPDTTTRRELGNGVGSPGWFRCQERMQAQIPTTATLTALAYSYTPAPGYCQCTVYSVAEPPRLCIIRMRPDPREHIQPSIADWKSLPADRCEHAIWKDPTNRHPTFYLRTVRDGDTALMKTAPDSAGRGEHGTEQCRKQCPG